MIGGNVRLFISDRNSSQNIGYWTAFQLCEYLYCRWHIADNIPKGIASKEVNTNLTKLFNNEIDGEAYTNILKNIVKQRISLRREW